MGDSVVSSQSLGGDQKVGERSTFGPSDFGFLSVQAQGARGEAHLQSMLPFRGPRPAIRS